MEAQLGILANTQTKLRAFPNVAARLQASLDKNPDLYFNDDLPCDERIIMKFAPLTTVDVERSFSLYRTILSDRRFTLTTENLSKLTVIQFNVGQEDESNNDN